MSSTGSLIRFITVFVILLGGSWPQELWAQEVCTFKQVTDSVGALGSIEPVISADGTRIVFRSHANLTDQSTVGRCQVFLSDTITNTFTLLTLPSLAGIAERKFNFHAVISADGTRIAFWSNFDLTGQNPAGNTVIFLYDITTNMFTQLVDLPPPYANDEQGLMAINADGTRIVFASDSHLTDQMPTVSSEIFLFDTTTMTLTQLTASPNPGSFKFSSFNPAINANGTRIVFGSHADLTGQNPDGNAEIFLVDTTTMTFTQLTDSASFSNFSPSLNTDGTRIVFVSRADLTGQNADGSEEIFLVDTTTMTFTQLTASASDDTDSPTINADGTRIAFESRADLTGQNADGNAEIFLATCPGTASQGVLENPQPNSFQSGIGVCVFQGKCASQSRGKRPLNPQEGGPPIPEESGPPIPGNLGQRSERSDAGFILVTPLA